MTKTTANNHQNGSLMDVGLFKIIGLYRLLHNSSAKNGCWGTVDWYRTLLTALAWLLCGLMSLQFIRLYLTLNDFPLFLYIGMEMYNSFLSAFKGYVLVKHADSLLAAMDVTRHSFTLCSRRDPSHLRQYRNVLYPWLRSFITLCLVAVVLWMMTPLFLHEYVPYVKLDNTVGHYRPSVYNIWLPLPETVYNRWTVWVLIYVVEMVACLLTSFFSLMFVCYIVTMCVALDAHLRTMTTAYATLGAGGGLHRHRHQGICTEPEYYNEMILHIKCTQKIIKIYDEFFDIIQPIVIIQITSNMYTTITLIFFCLLQCLTRSPILSTPILKFLIVYVACLIELYIFCYVFDHLETTKSKLNDGLWNGNWTEHDLKYKKTLLMAMIMNSSHKHKMKISSNMFVNLEMFAMVMKKSYTIVSVLINTRDKYTQLRD